MIIFLQRIELFQVFRSNNVSKHNYLAHILKLDKYYHYDKSGPSNILNEGMTPASPEFQNIPRIYIDCHTQVIHFEV